MLHFRDQGEAFHNIGQNFMIAGEKQKAARYFERARDVGAAHGFFSVKQKPSPRTPRAESRDPASMVPETSTLSPKPVTLAPSPFTRNQVECRACDGLAQVSSHTMHQTNGFRKSTAPPNRQLIISIY